MYLHGIPYAIAPDVQKDIPVVIGMSDEFIRRKAVQFGQLESQRIHSQRDIFHSVMGAFAMRSDAQQTAASTFLFTSDTCATGSGRPRRAGDLRGLPRRARVVDLPSDRHLQKNAAPWGERHSVLLVFVVAAEFNNPCRR